MQMSSFNFAAKIRLFAVPTLFFLSAQAAVAAEPITISSTVPYANGEVATPAIRQECHWNSDLPAAMVARSDGGIVATDKDLSTFAGRKLTMTVTSIHAAGGMFGGPKWAVIDGELTEDGKLQGSFHLRRATTSGNITSCGSLDKIGSALATDILKWLKNPSVSTAASAEKEAGSTGQ
jgi:hypothetical protein